MPVDGQGITGLSVHMSGTCFVVSLCLDCLGSWGVGLSFLGLGTGRVAGGMLGLFE